MQRAPEVPETGEPLAEPTGDERHRDGSRRPRRTPLLATAAVLIVLLVVGVLVGVNSGRRDSNAVQPLPSAASAPEAGPTITEAIFTGRSSGNELLVAVGFKDGRAVGYLCDGTQAEAWLEGKIVADQLELHGRDPATVVTGKVDQRSVLGSLTLKGRTLPFSAQIALGNAGLYESRYMVDGIGTRIGWIVLADGSQVGIRKRGDLITPAPPLDTMTLTANDGGAPVQAVAVNGATPIFG